MLQAGVKTQLVLRLSDILRASISKQIVNEGILTHMYHFSCVYISASRLPSARLVRRALA